MGNAKASVFPMCPNQKEKRQGKKKKEKAKGEKRRQKEKKRRPRGREGATVLCERKLYVFCVLCLKRDAH